MSMDKPQSEYLQHYGVLGMKWGIRRASKQLSKATTNEDIDSAVAKLKKHKSKASDKIAALDKKRVGLQKAVDKNTLKNDKRAIELQKKATKMKRKATRRFVSEEKAAKRLTKAMRLEAKAEIIANRSNLAKQKLEKNKTLTRQLNEGISTIDKALINKGKSLVGR